MNLRPDLSDDAFDNLLRESLQARPVPAPSENIADAAMMRATILEERAAHLGRLGRRLRLCSAAAGLLVAVAFAGTFFAGNSSTQSQDETGMSQATEATDTGSYAATLLAVVVVGLLTKSLLSGDRQEPLGVASPIA